METYLRQLDALQKIREIAGGQTLNLPQICVVGDQSSGKSSVLKLLTGVEFPVHAGTCTKAAIVVECKKEEGETCQIMDPVSKKYKNCEFSDLSNEILECQKKLLESGGTKISETEINIKVGGKDQIDLIVVDLPGIINVGAGKEETRSLISKYIKADQTLVFLVSEAKTDAELISAVELARQWDPEEYRTMSVLTKFDNFDSNDAQDRAILWIREGEDKALGSHAVIAAPDGKNYDENKEMGKLNELDLPQIRSGIAALKIRLPIIYAKLIQTNLPGLREGIENRMTEARKVLRIIGKDPVDGSFLIKKCQDFLRKEITKIEEDLSPPMLKLQEAIHEKEKEIDEGWISSKYVHNVFKIPFFSGEIAFVKCFSEIIEWWKPIVDEYIEAAFEAVDKVIDRLNDISVPKSLSVSLTYAWREMRKEILNKLDFGTINHYLTSEYQVEMAVSEDFINKFIESVNPGSYTNHVGETKDTLKAKLKAVCDAQKLKFDRKPLHEQQKARLFAAVKSAYKVEKKTFTDIILKATRIEILDAIRDWVNMNLFLDEGIKSGAREDTTTIKKREKSLDIIKKMNSCLKEINSIM